MMLCFKLGMPSNNSWNGKWSGEGRDYRVVRKIGTSLIDICHGEEIIKNGSYYYNFGDGWSASISVTEIDSREAEKIRKKSNGFCGYDWMIDSIITWGEILNSDGVKRRFAQNKAEKERVTKALELSA